jgi:hypothetical protein
MEGKPSMVNTRYNRRNAHGMRNEMKTSKQCEIPETKEGKSL